MSSTPAPKPSTKLAQSKIAYVGDQAVRSRPATKSAFPAKANSFAPKRSARGPVRRIAATNPENVKAPSLPNSSCDRPRLVELVKEC